MPLRAVSVEEINSRGDGTAPFSMRIPSRGTNLSQKVVCVSHALIYMKFHGKSSAIGVVTTTANKTGAVCVHTTTHETTNHVCALFSAQEQHRPLTSGELIRVIGKIRTMAK